MLKEVYENKIKQLVQIYQVHSKPDDFRSCEYKICPILVVTYIEGDFTPALTTEYHDRCH